MAKAPRFASREEYEAWKRERSGGAASVASAPSAPGASSKCATCGAPLPYDLATCAVCRPDPIEAAAYDGGDSGLELMERPPRQTVLPPLEEEQRFAPPASLLDAGLVGALAFGSFRRSRFCAAGLLGFFVLGKLMMILETGRLSGLFVTALFAWSLFGGMLATFSYNARLREWKREHGSAAAARRAA